MGKVSANKKLELIKAVRMQNHYNRQLFRAREGILYPELQGRHGELYGLEEDISVMPQERDKPAAGSLRIRFIVALMLLLFFILCDLNHFSYQGETTDTIYDRMTQSPDVTELFEFMS